MWALSLLPGDAFSSLLFCVWDAGAVCRIRAFFTSLSDCLMKGVVDEVERVKSRDVWGEMLSAPRKPDGAKRFAHEELRTCFWSRSSPLSPR